MKWIIVLFTFCSAPIYVESAKCWNVSQVMDFPKQNVYATRRYWQREAEPILRGAMYQMEDYRECVDELDGHYCMTNVRIQPTDNSTEFWKTLEEHTSVKTNYRRDVLYVGLCKPKYCSEEDAMEDLSEFLNAAGNKLKVSVNVSIFGEHCGSNEERPLIALDFITVLLIIVLFILVLSGSTYDGIRRIRNTKNTSFVRCGRFVTCFSVFSNCEKLLALSNSDDSIAFRSVQGIRAISMFLVILGHVCYRFIIGPLRNPEVIEEFYRDLMRISLINGQAIMGTFFCISGMMLSYFFLKEFEVKKCIKASGIIKAIVHRYIRLTPVMAVVILIQITLERGSKGPVWWGVVGDKVENCRLYGWTNLIYLHNYIYPENICLLHTWYVAADFQCYIICLLLLIPVCLYPQHCRKIFATALVFWTIVPFVHTYIERFDPVPFNTPEIVMHQDVYRTFNRRYITMHSNAGSFLIGVIFGYMCYYLRRKAFKRTKKAYILLWLNNLLVPWFILVLPFIFYTNNYTYNVIVACFYATFSKLIYAAGIGTIILSFALGYGGIINTALSWTPLQLFGRLSYCMYVIHPTLLYAETGAQMQPLTISELTIVQHWFKTLFTSGICALILVLCVEMPAGSLLKLIMSRGARDKPENEVHKMTTIEESITDTQTEEIA